MRQIVESVARLVTAETGVQLGEKQFGMVEGRIRSRLRELGIDVSGYREYLSRNFRSEIRTLVSLLTTHHTYFFREFAHFEFLERSGLARLVAEKRERGDPVLRIWSAACSYGQEAYSLAMFLERHLRELAPDFQYEIVATDVDPVTVGIAKNGVFHRRHIQAIPLGYLGEHWSRGKGEIADFYRARESIRSRCRFAVQNLREAAPPEGAAGHKFDIIFCRNVFIYFTSAQIRSTTERLLEALAPQGLLFVGISESLQGLGLPLAAVGPSIYARPAAAAPVSEAPLRKRQVTRVLCVDDSPSILKLLKKILGEDPSFEVVGTAANGREAIELLPSLKPDVVTLDIHMPGMGGVEFLARTKGKACPPVVVISTLSREEAALARRCLDLGAADYVEKPELANFRERGEEIRVKLECAVRKSGWERAA